MPMLGEKVDRMGGSRVISKSDHTKGYYQVVVKKENQEKTAFISPYGKFHSRLMEMVLATCRGFADAYMDDVVIYSGSWKDHLGHSVERATESRINNKAKEAESISNS